MQPEEAEIDVLSQNMQHEEAEIDVMSQNMQHEKADFSKQQNVEIIFVLSRKINYIFGIIFKSDQFRVNFTGD